MDLTVFEENKELVVEAFERGEFDFVEGVDEVDEAEFFRFIGAKGVLQKLSAAYPSPRVKQEVPVEVFVSSAMSLRLHGVVSYCRYPYVVRSGGMLSVFGPRVARKAVHPHSGDGTLACEGFNNKNEYDRQTPCDQDFLRKFARDTDVEALHGWFNGAVQRILRQHHAFDPEGIFIGDGSYLFVPDNPRYEGSSLMLFDEHNHPVSADEQKKLTPEQLRHCRWRRCYRVVMLLHTNRELDFFRCAGVRVLGGNESELEPLYELVDGFVAAVGPGVMRLLILDRGFIDGERIGRCKTEHGIDVVIPLRRNMDAFQDMLGLQRLPDVRFEEYQRERRASIPRLPKGAPERRVPERILRREAKRQATLAARKVEEPRPPPAAAKLRLRSEVAVVGEVRSWTSCPVPLTVTICRETYADGHEEQWMLADTRPPARPDRSRRDYELREQIEERWKQGKVYTKLASFSSRAFSLVTQQVVFVLLTYTLLQLYLERTRRAELNRRTMPRIRDQLRPRNTVVILYYANYFARLSHLEHQELVLTLGEDARQKVLRKTRQLRLDVADALPNPRPP
jgi:hypothetical protein